MRKEIDDLVKEMSRRQLLFIKNLFAALVADLSCKMILAIPARSRMFGMNKLPGC